MSVRHVLHDFGIRSKLPAGLQVVIFVSYTALVAAVVGVAEHSVPRHMAEHPAPWTVMLVALCTFSVSIMVLQLSDKIGDLHTLHRMKFKYYPAGGDVKAAARMYDAASKVIDRCADDDTCEIFAVNSFHEPFVPVGSNGAHERYFKILDSKLGRVHYERFIQCESIQQLHEHVAAAEEYRNHFIRVIELRDSNDTSIETRRMRLDMVAPMFPTAFVIVRHTSGLAELIWQLNEYTGRSLAGRHEYRVRGLLLVTDPDKHLIRHFEGWLNRLSKAPSRRIEVNDLHGMPEVSARA